MTSRALTLLVWALLGGAALGLSLLSAAVPSRLSTPRAALAALVASPLRRPILLLGWMWLGWHLFAR